MTAITAIDTAIEKVNIQRSKLGAVSNRLYKINCNDESIKNMVKNLKF
jgi:flagellin-like hook-associated protein FlgL